MLSSADGCNSLENLLHCKQPAKRLKPLKCQEVKVVKTMPFQPGVSGNPNGRPRGRMTWQDYADRIDYYLTQFSRSEIKTMVLDPHEFDKLVVRDALIVQTIAEALQVDGLASREKLLSRVIGEAITRGELTGKDGQSFFGADARAHIRGKLIPPPAKAIAGSTPSDAE